MDDRWIITADTRKEGAKATHKLSEVGTTFHIGERVVESTRGVSVVVRIPR